MFSSLFLSGSSCVCVGWSSGLDLDRDSSPSKLGIAENKVMLLLLHLICFAHLTFHLFSFLTWLLVITSFTCFLIICWCICRTVPTRGAGRWVFQIYFIHSTPFVANWCIGLRKHWKFESAILWELLRWVCHFAHHFRLLMWWTRKRTITMMNMSWILVQSRIYYKSIPISVLCTKQTQKSRNQTVLLQKWEPFAFFCKQNNHMAPLSYRLHAAVC